MTNRAIITTIVLTALSGTAFGSCGEGYIRLSYANSLENLARAVEQIKAFVASI